MSLTVEHYWRCNFCGRKFQTEQAADHHLFNARCIGLIIADTLDSLRFRWEKFRSRTR